jgi:YaiO family outer membrane protein
VQRRRFLAAALWAGLGSAAAAQTNQHALATSIRALAVDYRYATFMGDIDAWHMSSVSMGDTRSRGSVVGRVNYARRFATNGLQAEVDAYPTIAKGTYAYVNVGYSRSEIFPGWRSGAELFRSLPRGYEGSLGYRQLRFGGPTVNLFTGSLARSTANYWFSLRPYVRDTPAGASASASLTARWYGPDPDNSVGARLGFGTSPTDDVFLSQLARTSAMSAAINASRSASNRTVTNWALTLEREKFSSSGYRNRLEFGFGLKIRY